MNTRATVYYHPGEDGEIVVLKPHWYADNGYETCTFPTKDQAVAFCWERWRVSPSEVRFRTHSVPGEPTTDGGLNK